MSKGLSILVLIFFQTLHFVPSPNRASCPLTRRLTTRYCTFLGVQKKQHTILRSSTKVEYRAMAHIATQVTWLTSILKDLDVSNLNLQFSSI